MSATVRSQSSLSARLGRLNCSVVGMGGAVSSGQKPLHGQHPFPINLFESAWLDVACDRWIQPGEAVLEAAVQFLCRSHGYHTQKSVLHSRPCSAKNSVAGSVFWMAAVSASFGDAEGGWVGATRQQIEAPELFRGRGKLTTTSDAARL